MPIESVLSNCCIKYSVVFLFHNILSAFSIMDSQPIITCVAGMCGRISSRHPAGQGVVGSRGAHLLTSTNWCLCVLWQSCTVLTSTKHTWGFSSTAPAFSITPLPNFACLILSRDMASFINLNFCNNQSFWVSLYTHTKLLSCLFLFFPLCFHQFTSLLSFYIGIAVFFFIGLHSR